MPTPSPQLTDAIRRLGRGIAKPVIVAPNQALVEIADAGYMVDVFDAVESAVGHKMECIADGSRPGVCVLTIGEEF